MTRLTTLQAARLYREMVTRWLKAKREFIIHDPKPEPPAPLNKATAEIIFDECERDFNRSMK